MEKVKFLTGNYNNLPKDLDDGSVYFAISDEQNKIGQIYFDTNQSRYLMSAESGAAIAFATCETSGLSANKEIIINENNDWNLKPGSSLFVRFLENNDNINPTFSIFSFGKEKVFLEKTNIYYNNVLCQKKNLLYGGQANCLMYYIYDGKKLLFIDNIYSEKQDINEEEYSKIKPWVVHNAEAIGFTEYEDSEVVLVNAPSNILGRYYPVEMDSKGRGFVNVPWESNKTVLKPLVIGDNTYDGTEEVIIEIYKGE